MFKSSKSPKPALDEKRVQRLISLVEKRYPGKCEMKKLIFKVNQKCRDSGVVKVKKECFPDQDKASTQSSLSKITHENPSSQLQDKTSTQSSSSKITHKNPSSQLQDKASMQSSSSIITHKNPSSQLQPELSQSDDDIDTSNEE